MGNTILAHALYSCSKIIIDPEVIFSPEGNTHAISKYNNTNLIAWHYEENPRNDVKVILKIICKDWDELLRTKMSYSKFAKKVPKVGNFNEFGFTDAIDSSWIENLTIKYWTIFQNVKLNSISTIYDITLNEYVSGNTDKLQNAIRLCNWDWDSKKSNTFYKIMMKNNLKYFNWLDSIKLIVNACLDYKSIATNIEFWEKAIILAKVCELTNINPQQLHWNTEEYFLNNNLSLINSLKRLKHGKTI
jgi:hypothetical protein